MAEISGKTLTSKPNKAPRTRMENERGSPSTTSKRSGSIVNTTATTTIDPLKKILNADLDPRDLDPKQLKKAFLDLLDIHRRLSKELSELKSENRTLEYELSCAQDEQFERSEELIESNRQRKEMQKEINRFQRSLAETQAVSERAKSVIEHRDQLIREAGLVLYVDPEKAREYADKVRSVIPECLLSQSTAEMLAELKGDSLDEKFRSLIEENRRIGKELAESSIKIQKANELIPKPNPQSPRPRPTNRQENVEMRLKIERLEAELATLKDENNWLRVQSKRANELIEEAEHCESEALADKRKLQKELREIKDTLKQATDANVLLQARLDKLREIKRLGGTSSPKTGQ